MTLDLPANVQYQKWEVPDAQTVLLLVHGLGGHTGRWEPLAEYFVARGVSSYALSLRGFGDTPGIKGHIDSFDIYLSDIESLVAIIRKDYPHQRILLLGESLGGLICFLMAIKNGRLFSGLICLSPAFADTLNVDAKTFWGIIFSSVLEPAKQLSIPLTLSSCSRDEFLVKRMEADPREHRFATSRLLVETLLAEQRAKIFKNRMMTSVLFLLGGHDTIVSTPESMKVFKSLKVSDKFIKVYPEMYHALSIDLGRDEVFQDIFNWIWARQA
ncbi:MAG: alpha/beta fold hydrolase [Candidatus Omnitrophota bacterium]